jgi:acetoacetate decarboxylase
MSLKHIASAIGSSMHALAAGGPPDRPAFQLPVDEQGPQQFLMPAHFGTMPVGEGSLEYRDVTTMAVSYRTDPVRLARFLPRPMRVAEEPLITIFYAMNRAVDWLAGGGYNLMGVNAAVRFEGEVDQLDGNFCLALWENDATPITFGRELLGIPKMFAEIDDPDVLGGRWSAACHHRGHRFLDISIADLEQQSEQTLVAAAEASIHANWLGWKYIPNTGAPGAAVSHATLVPTSAQPRELWLGRGAVVWNMLTWHEHPTQSHIIQALAELPILEHGIASVTRGATSLQAPGKTLRALR